MTSSLSALARSFAIDARNRQSTLEKKREGGAGTPADVVTGHPGASQSHFFVMITGQVECGEFAGKDNLYCRYAFSFGNDWYAIHGLDAGLTQIARKISGYDQRVVWNFPIDVGFKSTNAFGWPRMAFSVFGVDGAGRDVIVGYGSMLVPTVAGIHERTVQMYAPQASSALQHLRSWVAGAYPEFFDSKFVTRSEGREVTRVRRTGVISVSINVTTRAMSSFGYNVLEPAMVFRQQGASIGTGDRGSEADSATLGASLNNRSNVML